MRWRLIILLIAATVQFHALVQDNRFHPDEAYFMSFARNAAVNGDWMLSGALDKPPLSIYASALSMMFVGVKADENGVLYLESHQGEFAGRLPNVFLAILLTALMMRLAYDLYHNRQVALLAGLLMATSPYLIAFGATAFTDMMMLFWMLFSLWMLCRRHFFIAGFALALSFASKEQALFILPFLIVLAWHNGLISLPSIARFVLSFAFGIVLLLLWDNARPETSIFVLGTLNNSPNNWLASPASYLNRLLIWFDFGAWLLSARWITLGLILISLFDYLRRLRTKTPSIGIDSILLLYTFAYLGLHTLLAFNQYDRYLLIILPFVVLFVAHGFVELQKKLEFSRGEHMGSPVGHIQGQFNLTRYLSTLFFIIRSRFKLPVGTPHAVSLQRVSHLAQYLLIIVLLFIGFSWQISQIPIGGDKGEHKGIDELADYLNSKPIATVIYDRWLGWELSYYMGQWSNKRRVYFPTPQALVDGALALDEIGDRYLVTPKDKLVDEWLLALYAAGFGLAEDYQSDRFTVYRLSPASVDA